MMVVFVRNGGGRNDADVSFCGDDGCIHADFKLVAFGKKKCLQLVRISFDGYGCCGCENKNTSIMDVKSTNQLMDADEDESINTTQILIYYLRANMKHLAKYEDALQQYGLI